MSDRDQLAKIYRRVGFGLAPGQLAAISELGAPLALDRLIDPDANGVPAEPDPWEGLDLTSGQSGADDGQRNAIGLAIARWLDAMATTGRPLEEWIRWFWHGHFVSALPEVKAPLLMVEQLRLFGREGLGDFRSLLRAVTLDAAMLKYLDGTESRADAVNENYGREVLELFALGVGAFSESDVRAGAEALTGWVARQDGTVQFVARRHDDRPKDYLGNTGVHDVDSVVDAIVGHPACPRFVTAALAEAIIGPGVDDEIVGDLASTFRDDGLRIRPLVRALIEAGVDGAGRATYIAPVPWLAAVCRAASVPPSAIGKPLQPLLRGAGQVPMYPPNVGGWPGGRAWLASSTTVARCSMATYVAAACPADSPLLTSIQSGDLAALAEHLGLAHGFERSTENALRGLDPADHRAALTVALAAPEAAVS